MPGWFLWVSNTYIFHRLSVDSVSTMVCFATKYRAAPEDDLGSTVPLLAQVFVRSSWAGLELREPGALLMIIGAPRRKPSGARFGGARPSGLCWFVSL